MSWSLTETQTITVISAISGAVVAACAAVATAWFARKNLRIAALTTRLKYFEDFRKWADEVADALTEAIHLCDLDPKRVVGESFFDRRHRLRITLSSMIDKGRWFFPNIIIDEHGYDKELGYRGYRHELLNGLVAAYDCMQKIDYSIFENNEAIKDEMTTCKRHFVGQVQRIIDPNRGRVEFERIHKPPRPQEYSHLPHVFGWWPFRPGIR